jgi:hypothetical protein
MSDKLLLESGSVLLLEDGSFLLLESSPTDWSAWKYSRALTDSAATALTNFVVKVPLTSANFDFSLAKADGSDLRVFDVTSGVILPLWLLDHDSVGQTATLYYKSINTSHAHTLYYGNPAAPAVSNFAAVFTHGTGFDSGWGDLATAVAGAGGAATRYPGTAGPNDPRDYMFWRLQETPTLSITDLPSGAQTGYTGIREFNLIRDGATNRVLKIGGLYYATFSRRPPTNSLTIDGWICSSTSKTGPWSNFSQMWTTGTEHLNYGSSCLKVGSTYYLYVTYGWANGGGNTPGLVIKLRTSTDLVTWVDQGTVIAPAIFNDAVSGPGTDIGNPWIMQCADGIYMLVVEGYGSSHIWACYGATSTNLTTWTALNSGNPLLAAGAGGTWEVNGAANPKCFQMPDNTYMMMYNGSDDVANFDWQIGFAYAAARAGPYTRLAANPVGGHLPGTYGMETAHLSWDEDGTSYFNVVQRFDTTSSTAHAFFIYPEKLQGGLLLSRDPTTPADGAATGRLLDAGNFTAEARSVILAHRSNGGTPILLGLWNAATLPTPGTSASLAAIRCVEIERNTHDRPTPGDVYLFYYDSIDGSRHSWNGSAWTTGATTFASDYAREVIARIADDGTRYILTALYADDGTVIAGPAAIVKGAVRPMPVGRMLLAGDPFTDSWCQAIYLRYVQVRPYAATEPAMVTGPRIGGAVIPLPLFSQMVA